MSPDEARAALWERGRTAWKLAPTPRGVYQQIRSNWGRNPFVLLAHRNFAKTTLGMTIADEECRRQPGQRWLVALRTKDQTQDVIREIMDYYLDGCPWHLRPMPVKSDYTWRYPNGSGLYFFGGDNQAIESVRGRGIHGGLFDEAGFQGDLAYNVRSVALPALAKLGVGMLLLTSTPSRDPGHDFETLYEEAKADGRAARVSVHDNPDLTPEWVADRARESGGVKSLDFRREYGCEFLADPNTTVLPGVTAERIAGIDVREAEEPGVEPTPAPPALVQPVPVAMNREWYASMDIGGAHLTGVLWGYYDPDPSTGTLGTVRIARELVHRNASTPELAADITKLERAMWDKAFPEYFERWADNNNLFLLHDLAQKPFRIVFKATRKDEKMAQVGILRRMIDDGTFVIDPSCTVLLATLKKAQWVKTVRPSSTRAFVEHPEIGHADLLDAALYLVRNVKRRPYPKPLPTVEQQIGVPWGRPAPRSRGIRELQRVLGQEGWREDG